MRSSLLGFLWSISSEEVEAVIMERLPRHIPSTVVDSGDDGVESSWN